jgi:XTP/dITP diphosphohydrolase
VATTNAGKLREFRQILEPLGFDVLGIDDLEGLDIVEDGETFADNALIKARAVSRATAAPAVADDSGLEVDALGKGPGVHSARYAGVLGPERDRANRIKLLEALAKVPHAERRARFVCALAWCEPGCEARLFRGELEGIIGTQERGNNGFGYDPVFIIPGDGRTVAELPPGDKNAISHRGHAIRQLLTFLHTR